MCYRPYRSWLPCNTQQAEKPRRGEDVLTAYAERMPSRKKTLAVLTVASLHDIALYGLLTGLGVEYVTQAVTVFKGV